MSPEYEPTVALEIPPLVFYPLLKGMLSIKESFTVVFHNNLYTFYQTKENVARESTALAEKLERDEKFIDSYFDWAMKLTGGAEKKAREFEQINFAKLSEKELSSCFQKFFGLTEELGTTITYARFEPTKRLLQFLKKSGLDDATANNYLMQLVLPGIKSYAVQEQAGLLDAAIKLKKSPGQLDLIAGNHLKNWGWTGLNWGFGKAPSFDEVKEKLLAEAAGEPEKKLMEFRGKHEKELVERNKLREKLLSKNQVMLRFAKMIEIEGFYRLHRRYVISRLLFSLLGAFEELERKHKINYLDALFLTSDELMQSLITGRKLPDLSKRKHYCLFDAKNKSIELLEGEKGILKAQELGLIKQAEIQANELHGMPACRGIVEGTVVLVRNTKDFPKIKGKSIIVAPDTTPDFVPIFEKALAIVTEFGGITSHAAIVSREMNVPCIVSVKDATKVLKDGYTVKVDANKGIINILKTN